MQVEAALKGILDNLSPTERKKAFGEIAKAIRSSNQKRIGSQVDPDGNPFAPRLRKKKGAIRRSMFTKLRSNRWMRATATADSATVEFVGFAGQVARVHHFGLRDRVNKRGLQYDYPSRKLLGLTDEDLSTIEQILIEYMAR